MKRVKIKPKKCPNPLFEKWLQEWKNEAAEKGSEMQYCFGKALKSLKQYPFTLNSGQECFILDNFGVKLCQMLDKRLEEHKKSNSDSQEVLEPSSENVDQSDGFTLPSKKKQKTKAAAATSSGKEYVPTWRSGGYAILITLFNKSNKGVLNMTKSDLQTAAQPLCDTSFKKPLPGSYCTGWSSMNTLLKKNLVSKAGNPPRFSLTESGTDMALRLLTTSENVSKSSESIKKSGSREDIIVESQSSCSSQVEVNGITFDSKRVESDKVLNEDFVFKKNNCEELTEDSERQASSEPMTQSEETYFLTPGSFDVVLLVDSQETEGKKCKDVNDATIRELKARSIKFEVRHLKVGDFLWICRDELGTEMVLPYIVERKRMDDLGASIKDGRFHEQKFRLKQCKVETVIYLVENYGSNTHRLGLPLANLQQACANTQIVDGFTVHTTSSHSASMAYLSFMTTILTQQFKDKMLMSCKKNELPPCNVSDDLISVMTFNDFSRGAGKFKKHKAKDMLTKQLVQLKGLSVEKAVAIVNKYPTFSSLVGVLQQTDGEKIIAGLKYGNMNRTVGPVIAKTLVQLYTGRQLE